MTGTDFFCNHNCSSLQQLPDRTEQFLTQAGGRVEVVASLSQGRRAAAQCDLFTHKSVPVIFEPPCIRTLQQTLKYPLVTQAEHQLRRQREATSFPKKTELPLDNEDVQQVAYTNRTSTTQRISTTQPNQREHPLDTEEVHQIA